VSEVARRITVVTSVWGAYVRYLPDFIAPLEPAMRTGVRLICVDNASTTPLPKLPAGVEVIKLDERIGSGAAANRGLREVTTDLVCFADVDDVLIPASWARLVQILDESEEAVAICGRPILWDPGANSLLDYSIIPDEAPRLAPAQLARALVLKNMFPVAGCLVRTEAAQAVGGYAEIPPPLDDWPFSLSLAWHGHVLFSEIPSFYYRIHRDSQLGGTSRRSIRRGRLAAYRELRRRLRCLPAVPLWLRLATWPLAVVHWRRSIARQKHRVGPDTASVLDDPWLTPPGR